MAVTELLGSKSFCQSLKIWWVGRVFEKEKGISAQFLSDIVWYAIGFNGEFNTAIQLSSFDICFGYDITMPSSVFS